MSTYRFWGVGPYMTLRTPNNHGLPMDPALKKPARRCVICNGKLNSGNTTDCCSCHDIGEVELPEYAVALAGCALDCGFEELARYVMGTARRVSEDKPQLPPIQLAIKSIGDLPRNDLWRRLFHMGYSYRAIGVQFGLSHPTIRDGVYQAEHGTYRPHRARMAAHRAMVSA